MLYRVKYFFLSLRIKTKFLLGMLLIILILAICIGNLTFYISGGLIKENTKELTIKLLNEYAQNIDYKAQTIRNIAFQSSKEVVESDILANRKTYGEYIEFFVTRHLNDIISQHRSSNEYIEAICMNANDDYYYWWYKDDENRYYISNDELEQVLEYLNDTNDISLWMPTQCDETIMFISKMISPETLSPHGFIMLLINKDYFLTLDANDTSVINDKQIAIVRGDNQVLIKDQILGQEETLQQIALQTKGTYTIVDGDMKYSAVSAKIEDENWKVISIISDVELLKSTKKLGKIIILTCMAVSMIALIIAYVIAEGITKNIRLLERNMQKVEDGNFHVRVKPTTYDEVGLLTLRFNNMMKKINELINTAYIERIQKQDAEFEVLKAQINPHFLYNTLGSVKWLSRMKGQEKIEEMIDSLIYLLRISIKGDKYITIEEELNYVNKYIDLQKIRFEDRFDMELDIDSKIKGCYVLQFILQPIVENAIYHGLEISKQNGLIKIKGYQIDEDIILQVIDNGRGMTEDQCKDIMHRNTTKYKGLNSIGIANVNKRIKMYFGDKYGISIDSQIGEGTIVSIRLPYTKDKYEADV